MKTLSEIAKIVKREYNKDPFIANVGLCHVVSTAKREGFLTYTEAADFYSTLGHYAKTRSNRIFFDPTFNYSSTVSKGAWPLLYFWAREDYKSRNDWLDKVIDDRLDNLINDV